MTAIEDEETVGSIVTALFIALSVTHVVTRGHPEHCNELKLPVILKYFLVTKTNWEETFSCEATLTCLTPDYTIATIWAFLQLEISMICNSIFKMALI